MEHIHAPITVYEPRHFITPTVWNVVKLNTIRLYAKHGPIEIWLDSAQFEHNKKKTKQNIIPRKGHWKQTGKKLHTGQTTTK